MTLPHHSCCDTLGDRPGPDQGIRISIGGRCCKNCARRPRLPTPSAATTRSRRNRCSAHGRLWNVRTSVSIITRSTDRTYGTYLLMLFGITLVCWI